MYSTILCNVDSVPFWGLNIYKRNSVELILYVLFLLLFLGYLGVHQI